MGKRVDGWDGASWHGGLGDGAVELLIWLRSAEPGAGRSRPHFLQASFADGGCCYFLDEEVRLHACSLRLLHFALEESRYLSARACGAFERRENIESPNPCVLLGLSGLSLSLSGLRGFSFCG